MPRKRCFASAVLAFSLGLLAFPVYERLRVSLWITGVWVKSYCGNDADVCLYARFERSGGINYSQFVYFFATEQAARSGLLSHQNVSCEAAYQVSVSWTDASNAVVSGPAGCEVESYLGPTKFTVEEIDSYRFAISNHKNSNDG